MFRYVIHILSESYRRKKFYLSEKSVFLIEKFYSEISLPLLGNPLFKVNKECFVERGGFLSKEFYRTLID
ncbi:hypothetical protein BF38_5489 (plasmid) [Bacillus thuringiensis]|uniref:Uncharacterized protein n=1 Tax=Bacillus thuringiensis TaxID=1428 RepID=A0AB33B5V3_BACTU|nr:hypothetical protein BF38_5489 [Bacillus thuringiensis]